jgi:hypothetical protein
MQLKISRIFIIIFLFSIAAYNASAQYSAKSLYKTAFGVRVVPFGVTFKTFLGQKNKAIELIGNFNDGFRVTGFYELHGDLTANKTMKWYFGFGAHGGYYDNNENDGISFGFDGIVGLDYKFKTLPINLSLDWQPSMELITPKTAFQADRGGIAARFAF